MENVENTPSSELEIPESTEKSNIEQPAIENNAENIEEKAVKSDAPTNEGETLAEGELKADSHELPLPTEEQQEGKKDIAKWAEKRLQKKQRETELLRLENEKLRQIAMQSQGGATPAHAFQVPLEAPRRDQFDDEQQYLAAFVRFENKRAADEIHRDRQQRSMLEAEVTFQDKLKQTLENGAEKYNDFEEKTAVLFSNDFPPNRAMAEAIVNSDFKDDILYFLGTYPKEATRIAQMNAVEAVKHITKLEVRFESRGKTGNASKAPKPIDSLNSNKSKTGSVENMQDLHRIAQGDDQRGFEEAVKKLANRRRAF